MKGGYKVIDLKKTSLSSTRVAIAGLKEALEASVGKAVLLTNVVIGEDEMDDCFSTVIKKSDDSLKLNCYDGYISVNASGVKYTSASTENLAAEIGDLDDLTTTDKDSAVEAINEVKENVDNLEETISKNKLYIDGYVNISSYSTAENPYTCFSDGYIYLYDGGSTMKMMGNNSNYATIAKNLAGGESCIFVRKGTTVYVTDASNAYFWPLV